MSPDDLITNGLAATGSFGFLFIVARWLWHYEQVVTNRYERQLVASNTAIDELRKDLDDERERRMRAEGESARLYRLLTIHGVDPSSPTH